MIFQFNLLIYRMLLSRVLSGLTGRITCNGMVAMYVCVNPDLEVTLTCDLGAWVEVKPVMVTRVWGQR